jgi:DNA-binding NtrC family response regulator
MDDFILIVDDEPELASIMERALRHQGYSVLTAGTGEQALELAASHEGAISLLISDLVMPGMGGRELAWRFRQAYPGIKLILCSGYADAGGALQMVEDDGMVTFLEKPVELRDLVSTVRQVLDTTAYDLSQ